MKKLVKHFWLVACVVLFVTPVLSACFMTKYTVDFVLTDGGDIEVKIGNTEVEHGSRHIHGKTITITVTPTGFNEIKSVHANNVELQGADGVYTHVLRSHVTINVQFDLYTTDQPCVLCGTRNCECESTALGLAKVDSIRSLLSHIEDYKNHPDIARITEIAEQAITDIMNVTTTGQTAVEAVGQVVSIFETAREQIYEITGTPDIGTGCTCERNCDPNNCNGGFCQDPCCFCEYCGGDCESPTCPWCGDLCWWCTCYDCEFGFGCCPSTTHLCDPACDCEPNLECECCICQQTFCDPDPARRCNRCKHYYFLFPEEDD